MIWLLAAWTKLAEKRPLLTLSVTNGVLGGVGDLLAQSIEHRDIKRRPAHGQFKWDFIRTLRFIGWGAACGPIFYKWYGFLNRRFPLPKQNYSVSLAKRVAMDQTVYAPIGIGAFFVAMNYMEGHGWQSARARLREFYLPTLAANYAIWPLVQTINFGFVPPIYRVPFTSVVSVFWNAFISWANAQSSMATLDDIHTTEEIYKNEGSQEKVLAVSSHPQ